MTGKDKIAKTLYHSAMLCYPFPDALKAIRYA
jgi:hypothetical protein